MNLVEMTTIPAFELPIEAFREHLRTGTGFSDDTLQDTLLESVLRGALAAIEARTGKALLSRSFSWTLAGWRTPDAQALPIAPVQEISSITTTGPNGDQTLHDASDVTLVPDSQRPLMRATGSALPTLPSGGTAEVIFTAGFATLWEDLPADLKLAVMSLAAYYYENRGDASVDDGNMPFQVTVLIERYRTVRILGGAMA